MPEENNVLLTKFWIYKVTLTFFTCRIVKYIHRWLVEGVNFGHCIGDLSFKERTTSPIVLR